MFNLMRFIFYGVFKLLLKNLNLERTHKQNEKIVDK